jgi:hypothetical protein
VTGGWLGAASALGLDQSATELPRSLAVRHAFGTPRKQDGSQGRYATVLG